MMANDSDVAISYRKNQPAFFGYIPNNNTKAVRCLVLMTLMSTLHNLSRSVGCAILLLASTKLRLLYVLGGEVCVYFAVVTLRGDFYGWEQMEGINYSKSRLGAKRRGL